MPHHINFPNTNFCCTECHITSTFLTLTSDYLPVCKPVNYEHYSRGAQLSWVWGPVFKFKKLHWTQHNTNSTLSIWWLRKHIMTKGCYEFSNTFKWIFALLFTPPSTCIVQIQGQYFTYSFNHCSIALCHVTAGSGAITILIITICC
jgi:hypothetical protein